MKRKRSKRSRHTLPSMRASVLLCSLMIGCGSSDSTTGPTDTSVVDSAASDGKASDAPVDTTPPAASCVVAGGQCGCAGGCPGGTHHGSAAEDNSCPQPCDGCGACSEWCCLPDLASDAGDAGDARDASDAADANDTRDASGD
jgi:hypothetical protein